MENRIGERWRITPQRKISNRTAEKLRIAPQRHGESLRREIANSRAERKSKVRERKKGKNGSFSHVVGLAASGLVFGGVGLLLGGVGLGVWRRRLVAWRHRACCLAPPYHFLTNPLPRLCFPLFSMPSPLVFLRAHRKG